MKSKEKYYDVMFIELMWTFQCYLPLAEKLNIPAIGTVAFKSWTLTDVVFGNSRNPAVIPFELSSFSDRMTRLERFQNLWKNFCFHYKYNSDISKKLTEIYDKFYTPDLLNKKQISLVFANNHITLSSRPSVPNVIDVGGIHVKPAKSLPEVNNLDLISTCIICILNYQ